MFLREEHFRNCVMRYWHEKDMKEFMHMECKLEQ